MHIQQERFSKVARSKGEDCAVTRRLTTVRRRTQFSMSVGFPHTGSLAELLATINEADVVTERTLATYETGLSTWSLGTLHFAEHFYEEQIQVTNGAEKWVTALALVRAELIYRKLSK